MYGGDEKDGKEGERGEWTWIRKGTEDRRAGKTFASLALRRIDPPNSPSVILIHNF